MRLFSKEHDPKKTRVVIAMSGGVDSSVTAALIKEAGYDVVGITLQLYDHGQALDKKGACCAGKDIYDARRVAETIGFPHYVLDYEKVFRAAVVDDFATSYMQGETPIPCVRCNQRVKFKDMLHTARELGAEALVTGHYAQRLGDDNNGTLYRAKDLQRDQSYFLFATTQEQLNFLRFPLGGMTKPEVRAQAERLGLTVAQKPDSQDICFVPSGKYAQAIQRLRPGALEKGLIVHADGRVLGEHEGIINYTIGQRRGIGMGGGEPLYVIAIDPVTHRVIVGPRDLLACTAVSLKEMNWLSVPAATRGLERVMIKFRSTQPPQPARIEGTDEQPRVVFQEPEYGVSPGQACVFYDGDRLLGGGWISATETSYSQYQQHTSSEGSLLSATQVIV